MSKLLASGWTFLAIAIVLEVIATWFLKLSNGFEKLNYAVPVSYTHLTLPTILLV